MQAARAAVKLGRQMNKNREGDDPDQTPMGATL